MTGKSIMDNRWQRLSFNAKPPISASN